MFVNRTGSRSQPTSIEGRLNADPHVLAAGQIRVGGLPFTVAACCRLASDSVLEARVYFPLSRA